MLKLLDIVKDYGAGDSKVKALKGINIAFRDNEFVSVLGPSGCGKTTLLNIIGGLDRYTSGDLQINGKPTCYFSANEWDSYRNNVIGFVFQNYNLIPHLSVLDNVEIALTLSGVSNRERRKRAKETLEKVGLLDQINKKPNQLSGGQMQRVAIARALVNNPRIVLADEPTGALDSGTSIQIMELLKEISRDRLVIMVTHNREIAQKYSTRIISLNDGVITGDSNPYICEAAKDSGSRKKQIFKKTSMSFFTALKLSFNNLRTKKMRTIITSVAGSIGIIGIALVLSISSGMTNYIDNMQSDTLGGFPLTVPVSVKITDDFNFFNNEDEGEDFPEENVIYPYNRLNDEEYHFNYFDENFLSYLKALDSNLYNSISYVRGLAMNLFIKTPDNNYSQISNGNIGWQELPPGDNFITERYDVLSGEYPKNSGEIVLIVNEKNQINEKLVYALGIDYTQGETLSFDDFIGKEIKQADNDIYYYFNEDTGKYVKKDNAQIYNDENTRTLKITGVIRVKEKTLSKILNWGIGYTASLTEEVLAGNVDSDIVISQKSSPGINVCTKIPFNNPAEYAEFILRLGGESTPLAILIYPKTFGAKEEIKNYLDAYNNGKTDSQKIIYQDLAQTVTDAFGTLVDTISVILSAFAAISLVVSSIMIGIITYVSVMERTKEIGILRSIGARKKDIRRVFNAETVIIGFISGVIGIAVTLILIFPLNSFISGLAKVDNLAFLPLLSAVILISVSVCLTFIAGLIPSGIAAKKDPVTALRTE